MTSDASAPPNLVVDGSNIATEGRSLPSLAQLDEAVTALLAEREFGNIIVVVDATFAHRIDSSEKPQFEAAIEANELIMPPAGVVGRGDAFLLAVADKADAQVFSNDSFQEFHGTYTWLFDDDRLIGGKPIPALGWVFVNRLPVRGPTSRRAVREAKQDSTPSRRASRSAQKKTSRRRSSDRSERSEEPKRDNKDAATDTDGGGRRGERPAKRRKGDELNEPPTFLAFVARYSIGDTATAVVDRYSSHGCYVLIGEAQAYLPLKSMGEPAPAKARDLVSRGQEITVRVESLDAERRGINVGLESLESSGSEATPSGRSDAEDADQIDDDGSASTDDADESAAEEKPARKRRSRSRRKRTDDTAPAESTDDETTEDAAPPEDATDGDDDEAAPTKKAAAKRGGSKKATAKKSPAKKAAAKKTPAKKSTTKKKATAKKPADPADGDATTTATRKSTPRKSAAARKAASSASADDSQLSLPAPARRALAGIGITTLAEAAGRSEKELLDLHGFGPGAARQLASQLADAGLDPLT